MADKKSAGHRPTDDGISTATVRELANRLNAKSNYYKGETGTRSRFPIFLGAGASVESGVPPARRMVKEFIDRICRTECPEIIDSERRMAWLKENVFFTEEVQMYSALFEKCFPTESDRRDFIESQIEGRDPSLGYVALAHLMQDGVIDTIITTNFDDLVYQACTSFTDKRPIVFSLGGFASEIGSVVNRPRVLKIHGDFMFSSFLKNTTSEISHQDANFTKQLSQIFEAYRGLIVVGYEGNDKSIMDLLTAHFPKEKYLYWCVYQDSKINDRVKQLLEEKGGQIVRIQGFDSLMMEICESTNIESEKIISTSSGRVRDLCNKFISFAVNQRSIFPRDSADRKKQMASLNRQFMKIEKSFDVLAYFVMGDLAYQNKKYEEAQGWFKRALSLKPQEADAHYHYAKALSEDDRRFSDAEAEFVITITLNPKDAYAYNRFGKLLSKMAWRWPDAEKHHLKAIELKPTYSFAYFEYANLLRQDENRFEDAERLYRQAIELEPAVPDFYYALGSFLRQQGRKDDLLELFNEGSRRNVRFFDYFLQNAIESKLNNDRQGMSKFIRKAQTVVDVDNHYDLARLYAILNDDDRAISHLEKAMADDPGKREAASGEPAFETISWRIGFWPAQRAQSAK